MHCVDIDFAEEHGWHGDGQRNENLGCLMYLADVASSNVPSDVASNLGPPKVF